MLATSAAQDYFGTSLDTDQAFIEHIYLNTLGKTYAEDSAGIDAWVERLATTNEGDRGLTISEMIEAIMLPENDGSAAQTQFINRVEVSNYTADNIAAAGDDLSVFSVDSVTEDDATVDAAKADVDVIANPEVEGQTFVLTDGRDNVTGTADADTIKGYVGQNQDGALANALATGDMIDGGGSTDTLIASLTNDEYVDSTSDDFAPMPIIDNVENIRIQALDNSIVNDTVILDADMIANEAHYASDSSRADLVITNVDIEADEITKDISLEMKDTQQNSDLAVYFDDQDLLAKAAEATTTAQYFLKVGDGEATDESPISNVKMDITLDHNGNSAVLEDIVSTDGTYAGLVAAIEAALIAEGLSDKYSVELGDAFTTIVTTNETTDASGNEILITSLEGVQFAKEDMNFSIGTVNSSVANLIASNADVLSNTVTNTSQIESDIIVDNVGRGSNGGEIVIGSTSNSAGSKGVEVINVEVRESSVIHDISTTNTANASWDGLQEITLTNGTGYEGDFVLTNSANAVDAGVGAGFYGNVDDQATDFTVGLDKITATDFDGDIVLGRDNDIVDLGTLDANVAGDVTFNSTYASAGNYVVGTGAGGVVT